VRVLAVTCYTGDEELVKMTERCFEQMLECVPEGVQFNISATKQGAVRAARHASFTENRPKNVGFAFGMNQAFEAGLSLFDEWDFVLCFNNDLLFPQKDWLRVLLEIAEHPTDQIIVPATDSAAIRIQPGPRDKNSVLLQESSAYCWLVPFAWCQWLKDTYGFWLFSEDFGVAYGEDNWTAYLLSKQFGPKVFRYVPRSFVKHLRARTSRTVKHDRKRSNRVLVDKLNKELSDPGLRSDLRQWARGLVKILSQRL
jgi:hypothetical protein